MQFTIKIHRSNILKVTISKPPIDRKGMKIIVVCLLFYDARVLLKELDCDTTGNVWAALWQSI